MFRLDTARRWSLALLLTAPVACATPQPVDPADPVDKADDWPTTDEATLYAMGVFLGGQLTLLALDPEETENLVAGVRDAALNNEPRHPTEASRAQIEEFRDHVRIIE